MTEGLGQPLHEHLGAHLTSLGALSHATIPWSYGSISGIHHTCDLGEAVPWLVARPGQAATPTCHARRRRGSQGPHRLATGAQEMLPRTVPGIEASPANNPAYAVV